MKRSMIALLLRCLKLKRFIGDTVCFETDSIRIVGVCLKNCYLGNADAVLLAGANADRNPLFYVDNRIRGDPLLNIPAKKHIVIILSIRLTFNGIFRTFINSLCWQKILP